MNTKIYITPDESKQLYRDVCGLIENTRQRVAVTANADICIMQWQIGKRIKEDVLYNKRAEYGKQIIQNLSAQLTVRFGKGWSVYKLQHCVRAAYAFSEDEIMYAVRTQLTWTHLRSLMSIDDALKRSFYVEMCKIEHWDTRTLDEKIDAQLYDRTALSKKPEYEGQMLLYLRYLNKNERKEGEESPIGLILCSEGNTEHIEYLMLEDSSIKVAQYYTQLPDKNILKEKLQRAITIAREHYREKYHEQK
jgi:hypothetical protein